MVYEDELPSSMIEKAQMLETTINCPTSTIRLRRADAPDRRLYEILGLVGLKRGHSDPAASMTILDAPQG